jgi:hypothetical protein
VRRKWLAFFLAAAVDASIRSRQMAKSIDPIGRHLDLLLLATQKFVALIITIDNEMGLLAGVVQRYELRRLRELEPPANPGRFTFVVLARVLKRQTT